jgi:hypothetical protein
MDPERERELDQWEAWANGIEPDMRDWEAEVTAWRAHHADAEVRQHDCMGESYSEEEQMKSALWKAIEEPLDWWFYPGTLGFAALGNVIQYGLHPSAVYGGILAGVVAVGLLCGMRRWFVGHWR